MELDIETAAFGDDHGAQEHNQVLVVHVFAQWLWAQRLHVGMHADVAYMSARARMSQAPCAQGLHVGGRADVVDLEDHAH